MLFHGKNPSAVVGEYSTGKCAYLGKTTFWAEKSPLRFEQPPRPIYGIVKFAVRGIRDMRRAKHPLASAVLGFFNSQCAVLQSSLSAESARRIDAVGGKLRLPAQGIIRLKLQILPKDAANTFARAFPFARLTHTFRLYN